MPTIVYKFGARNPTLNAQVVQHQLWLANQYYNRQIDRINGGREAYRRIRSAHAPDIDRLEGEVVELTSQLEAAEEALKAARAASRKRLPPTDEHRVLVDRLKSERRAKGDQLKAARAAFKAQLSPANEAFEALLEADYTAYEQGHGNLPGPNLIPAFKARVRKTLAEQPQWPAAWQEITALQASLDEASYEDRAHFSDLGLTPGTSGLVDRSVQQAYKPGPNNPHPQPRRKPFTGEGRVGVQIQGGCTLEELFNAGSTYVQIDPVPEAEYDRREYRGHSRDPGRARPSGQGRNSMARTNVRIRVGSEGQRPVWATFPVTLHRRLPADASVRYAWINVFRIGNRWEYTLDLTINTERVRCYGGQPTGTAAVNLGWRLMEDGSLRVMTLVSDRGETEYFTLEPELVSRLGGFPESIRGANDTLFDQVVGWMREHRNLTGWLPEALQYSHSWHAHGRLVKIVQRLVEELSTPEQVGEFWAHWSDERLTHHQDLFVLDEALAWLDAHGADETLRVVMALEFWRRKEAHLYQMSSDIREAALRQRKDLYRKWAYRLRGRYAKLVVGKVSYKGLAEKPSTEEEGEAQEPRHQRTLAAPSTLQGALSAAFAGDLSTRPAVNITRRCHVCHRLCRWDQALELEHTCEHCGAHWDQDQNAALNLLATPPASGEVVSTEEEPDQALPSEDAKAAE